MRSNEDRIAEGHIPVKWGYGQGFGWFYTERGQETLLVSFAAEAEAVAHAFRQIDADPWTLSHCIQFNPAEI